MDIDQLAARIALSLDAGGWCVIDSAFPEPLIRTLATRCATGAAEAFTLAGIGRGHQRQASIRSDLIRWLDAATAADADYLTLMSELRLALNQRLLLGLFDYECHYARYLPGAYYRRHVDAFVGSRNRVLSTVLYLNENWRAEEGGELVLYAQDCANPVATLLPQYNRLVVFLSEGFPHEVKPATRLRHSIAGWFRVRA